MGINQTAAGSVQARAAADRARRVHVDTIGGRAALTLIEVMVAMAVLTTAMTAIMSGILSMHVWQQTTSEEAVAHRTASLLAERIIGARWGDLGQAAAPWSWHRREFPRQKRADGTALHANTATPMVDAKDYSPRYAPMTERAANPDNDLIAMGLLNAGSGVRDMKVYLEYYDSVQANSGGDMLLRGGNGDPAAVLVYPRRAVTAAESAIDCGLPEAAVETETDHLDISIDPVSGATSNASIIVRILVTWTSSAGGTRRYELVLARKQ